MNYAWIVWLALILVFIIIEMLSLELTFLMLAVASVAGVVLSLVGAEWWLQILVVAALSVGLLFFLKPALLRALHRGGDTARSNMDALLGNRALVTVPFTPGPGQVRMGNGEVWTARIISLTPPPEPELMQVGQEVLVTAIEGATAVVAPLERTTP